MAETIQIDVDINSDKASQAIGNLGKSAKSAGGDISTLFGGGAFGEFSALAAKASLVTFAIKEVVDISRELISLAVGFSETAEKIRSINYQFEALSKNAGISGEQLKSALEGAGQGLVDDEDLLQAANKSIIALGSSAERLPEVFTLARKASSAFGLDIVQTFETLNMAIASGSTKQLRQLNLFIDSEAAIKKFEKSIGAAAGTLNQMGRQQAILNEVLEKGNAAYAGLDETSSKTTLGSKKLGAAFGNLKDSASIAFDAVYGNDIRTAIAATTFVIEGTSNTLDKLFQPKAPDAAKRVIELTGEIKTLGERLEYIQSRNIGALDISGQLAKSSDIDSISRKISDATQELKKFQSQVAMAPGGADFVGPIQQPEKKKETKPTDFIEQQAALDAANRAKREAITIEQQLISITQNRIQSEQDALKGTSDRATVEVGATRLRNEQMDLLNRQFTAQAAQLVQQEKESKIFNKEQLNEALLQLELDFQAKMKAIKDAAAIEDANRNLTLASSFSSVAQGFKDAAADFAKSADQNFKKAGASLMQFAAAGAGQAFAAFGKAIAKGENAMAAFATAFLSAVGDAAVALGTNFLLTGIAYSFSGNPEWEAKAGPLMAAGAALAAFGGVLSGLSGGGAQSSGAGAGSGIGSTPTADIQPSELEAEKKSRVTVNIQGDVLDSRDTGLRIVELIQQAFDTSGAVASVGRA